MDKRIIFSVAGSGKTSLILDRLNLEESSVIITYTDNNFSNLRIRIIKKFGYFPDNIRLYSYFTFLYSFCYKPFLAYETKAKGINWKIPPAFTMKLKRDNIQYYLDDNNRLYHNRIAKILEQAEVLDDINLRLEKYYDNLFVDEVQDFAGHDFNFLSSICQSKINITLVGDYFQHTFDTSRDGNTNKNLHQDYEQYKLKFDGMGLFVDLDTLNSSYRCSPTVCEFISKNIGINISSHRSDNTTVSLIEDEAEIDDIFMCTDTVKLFYQNQHKYSCYSQNWGGSKGQDHYEDVCIVLNAKSYKLFMSGTLSELPPQSKNKLYVACSRARRNLFFVSDKFLKKYKQV